MGISRGANLDFWDYEEEDRCLDMPGYYGSDEKRYFELSFRPLNRGNVMTLIFLIDADNYMSLTTSDIIVKIAPQQAKGFDGPPTIFNLGDVPIDDIVSMAASLLKIYCPELIDEEAFKSYYFDEGDEKD